MLLFVWPGAAYSDEELSELGDDELTDEFAFLEDAAMVESAARHRQEIGMSPSAITVITREDIETSGATTIPDLLRIVPGMEVVVTCPFFRSLASRLYWTTEGQYYLVLVDGREANLDFLGFPPWMIQPILIEDIERIEIIRGPGASLYGANAVSGVISITTRAVPEESSVFVNMRGGEVGTMYLAARASARAGNWGFSLSGGCDCAGSFEDHRGSASLGWKLRSLVEYRWSDSERLLLDAGLAGGTGSFTSSVGMVEADWGLRTLRLAYESEDLRGRLYWFESPSWTKFESTLDFMGITLARFMPIPIDIHTLDAEIQWNPPRFLEPLLLITGASGRAFWVECNHCLDAQTYADITNPRYHQPGVEIWRFRAGAYVHAEFSPADWVTVTGGLRFDWNDETESFLSPRLAAVFQPADGQFVRMGVARAFRKPSYMETCAHPMVEFPDESPITGTGQDMFQEFMTRMMGNSSLDNEHLLSFEVGYLGEFADRRLTVTLDLYYTQLTNFVELESKIVPDELGVSIDMEQSHFRFENNGPDLDIFGGELAVRYSPGRHLSFLASWTHREVFSQRTGGISGADPKNLITVGGRFRTEWGLLGSLYAFSRSEFTDVTVHNPAGLLEPVLTRHLDNVVLIIGRLGWKFPVHGGLEIEAGAKLFLPVSPSGPPYFRYREEGGGVTAAGEPYGGELLRRMVTGYLQGTF